MSQQPPIKLSFCIATYNRAEFIGETLESIISQATDDCEIVVCDNASTDNTREVVSEYAQRFDRLRYIRHDTNKGLDRNFDAALTHARGEYCWLKTDDDLLKPGAVPRLLDVLGSDWSLVVVNMEQRDVSMSQILRYRWINFDSDRTYERHELDRLYLELDHTLMNIGNIIVRRSFWFTRERERYYGSLLIHLGVIFQQPLPGRALVIAEPLISYRGGNTQSFSSMWPEILLSKWPSIIESSAISESARKRARNAIPRWNFGWMLFLRFKGYSVADYRRWIRPRLRSARQGIMPLLVALLPDRLVMPVAAVRELIMRNLDRFRQARRLRRYRKLETTSL